MNEELFPLHPPRDTRPFWVPLAGITHPSPAFRVSRLDPGLATVEYVVKGHGIIMQGGHRYDAGPHDIFIVAGADRPEFRSAPTDPMHKIFFNVRGDLLRLLLSAHRLENEVVFRGTGALPVFREGIRIIRAGNLHGRALQHALELILHRIILACAATLPDAEAALPEDVRTVKRYLDARTDSNVTMDELCALVHKSRMQVIRSFKNAMGQPPYDYFLSLKAEQAKLLLRNTSRPVKDIGYGLAFGDEYHFSTFFKKRVGMSPLKYRNG